MPPERSSTSSAPSEGSGDDFSGGAAVRPDPMSFNPFEEDWRRTGGKARINFPDFNDAMDGGGSEMDSEWSAGSSVESIGTMAMERPVDISLPSSQGDQSLDPEREAELQAECQRFFDESRPREEEVSTRVSQSHKPRYS